MYYSPKDIRKLLGISRQRLTYWKKKGIVVPTGPLKETRRLYTFVDLICLKRVLKLNEYGVSTYKTRKIVNYIREHFSEIPDPILANASITFELKKILVEFEGFKYDAETAQGFLIEPDPVECEIYNIEEKTQIPKTLKRSATSVYR